MNEATKAVLKKAAVVVLKAAGRALAEHALKELNKGDEIRLEAGKRPVARIGDAVKTKEVN